MCDPFSGSIALTAGKTVLGFMADSEQADAANASAITGARNATTAQNNSFNQLGIRQQQEDVKTANEVQEKQIEGAQAESLARLTGGENGVEGFAVESLAADFARQEARFIDDARYNNTVADLQADADRKGVHTDALGRYNANVSNMRSKPSPLAAALRIGGGVLDAGTRYKGWGT